MGSMTITPSSVTMNREMMNPEEVKLNTPGATSLLRALGAWKLEKDEMSPLFPKPVKLPDVNPAENDPPLLLKSCCSCPASSDFVEYEEYGFWEGEFFS